MKEITPLEDLVRRAVESQREGLKEEALSCLADALEQGSTRKEIADVILQRIITTVRDEEVGEVSPYLPDVIDHLSKSAQQVLSRCHHLCSILAHDHPLRDDVLLLNSEISILHHEISISMHRSQFGDGSADQTENHSSLAELNKSWLARITSRATSQLGQDLWVLKRCSYKRQGFFVEFGATNGVLLSNSYLLEKEFGWDGICAEPNPKFLEALKKNRLCTVSGECIGPVTGEEVDFVFADVFGGMLADIANDEHHEKRKAYRDSGATARLTTISLNDFLLKHDAPETIDYLSVDTEGSEFAILETFPFDKWDIRHISVEHNETPQRELIRNLLSSNGYKCQEAQWDDWFFKD